MGIIVFFIISYILLSISLYFLFPKAKQPAWHGLVPGLNFVTWAKIIGKPILSVLWLLFPIVNIFTFANMCIDMTQSFGKFSFKDSFLAVLYPPAYFLNLAFGKHPYQGPAIAKYKEYQASIEHAKNNNQTREYKKLIANSPYKKTVLREWTESIIFAVFAAAFIRMFLIEAYVIPTGSMEGSLLVGDYLFVSKAHYGIRTPQTVLMIPLLHNRLPFNIGESYFEKPSLPYFRSKAIEPIDNNDPIVFNYPEGDSVYIFPERNWSVYDYRRNQVSKQRARQIKNGQAPLVTRPLDKRDHYVKRAIAVAGDTLQIINKEVFINGKRAIDPPKVQYSYTITSTSRNINSKLYNELDIDVNASQGNTTLASLHQAQIDELKKRDPKIQINPFNIDEQYPIPAFPHDPQISKDWNRDNYGPIWIPKKGDSVNLTPQNISLYRRIITVYEGNTFTQSGNNFTINGQKTNQYKFKWDYYWAMGDNRHNSEDSRVWGFVPESHIVGKPWFIWFSTKDGNIGNGINFHRIFTNATQLD